MFLLTEIVSNLCFDAASQDDATSPCTDEERPYPKHKRLKSAPPSVNRRQKWLERKEHGQSRFVEVSDGETAPKGREQKTRREAWDEDQKNDGKKTPDYTLLKVTFGTILMRREICDEANTLKEINKSDKYCKERYYNKKEKVKYFKE